MTLTIIAAALFIVGFWTCALLSAEEEREQDTQEAQQDPLPYTEGWQDESVHWHVDRYGRLLDENDGVYINPLL
jgi:hypothetical protein